MCPYFACRKVGKIADVTQITIIMRPPEELRFGLVTTPASFRHELIMFLFSVEEIFDINANHTIRH
jgi:hypothetical protein